MYNITLFHLSLSFKIEFPEMIENEIIEIAIHTVSAILIHLFEMPININMCSLT